MVKKSISSRLEPAEIERFSAAKFPNGTACPRCGDRHWTYQDETPTNELLGLSIMGDRGETTGLYATIVFVCDNCGFVAPHAKSVVVNWLNDHE